MDESGDTGLKPRDASAQIHVADMLCGSIARIYERSAGTERIFGELFERGSFGLRSDRSKSESEVKSILDL